MVAELRAPKPWPAMVQTVQPRGRSHDSHGSASGISSTSLLTRFASRVRARSVPAASSPTAHRPGVDLRPFASGSQAPAARQQTGPQYYNVGTLASTVAREPRTRTPEASTTTL